MPALRLFLLLSTVAIALGACARGGDEPVVAHVDVAGFEYGYRPATIEVPVGRIEFTFVNEGDVPHTFVIEGHGFKLRAFDTDSRSTGDVALTEGAYFFYCDVLEHREQGMEGSLYVGDVDRGR